MDWSLFHTVNRWSADSPWAHGFFRSYANYGIVLFGLGLAALIALTLNQPLADLIDRARPFASHRGVLVLVDKSADPGFLSDHAVVTGAVAVGLIFAVRRIGLIALGGAVLMAFARVYVGAHYPGDVVAGLLFGGAIAALGIPLADRYLTPLCRRVCETPVVARFART